MKTLVKRRISKNAQQRVRSCILTAGLLLASFAATAETDLFAQHSLRVGFFSESFPDVSRTDLDIGVKFWGEEIGKSENIPVLINFYDKINDMRNDFEQGKINFIVASAWVVVTQFKRDLLADGFKASRSGAAQENLIVVSRKNQNLDHFQQLAGKKLGTLNHDPIADAYLDTLSLTHFAKPYKQVFSKPVQENKSTKLVINLFFKKMDAIVIYQSPYELAIELNPQVKEQTQIIEQIAGIPWGTGFFHRKVDPAFRERIIAEAAKLKNNARGQQLMQIFNADRFERSRLTDLEATEALKVRYLKLLHPQKL